MKGIARLVPLHCGIFDPSASRYHGVKPEEADWSAPERQIRAVAEFLGALDDEDADADRRPPKVISLSDTCSAWTAKANKTFCDDISEFESYMPSHAVRSAAAEISCGLGRKRRPHLRPRRQRLPPQAL